MDLPGSVNEEVGATPMSMGTTGGRSKDKKELQLGAVEAQWIVSVLDDTLKKLLLMSYLTPELAEDKVLDSVDHEVSVALRGHFEVESNYLKLLAVKEANGEVLEDPKQRQQLEEWSLCLADSCRTVARLLKSNPVLIHRAKELGAQRPSTSLEYLNTFTELRALMEQSLSRTAEAEKELRAQLEELTAQNEADQKRYLAMTHQMAISRQEHAKSLEQKNDKIERVRRSIEEVKLKAEADRAAMQQEFAHKAAQAEAVFKEQEKRLAEDVKALQQKVDEAGMANFAAELQHHRKKFTRAMDVKKIINTYDNHMTTKHTDLVNLQDVYKKESEELKELKTHFDAVDKEEQAIREEQHAVKIRRNQQLEDDRRAHQASTLMQTLFHDYHIRQADAARRAKIRAKKEAKERAKNPFAAMIKEREAERKKKEAKIAANTKKDGAATARDRSRQRRRSAQPAD